MRFAWANLALLILLGVQLASGYFGFTNGFASARWLLWIHGICGFAILVLLVWKTRIILDALRRGGGLDLRRYGFLLLTGLLLVVLLSGFLWTSVGPLSIGGFSLITLHILVGVGLMALLAWHTWVMRFILRHPDVQSRRFFLRLGGIGLGGLLLWTAAGRARALLAWSGATRRFTGSYETGSFSGIFPAVSWIADRPAPVDVEEWQLSITGQVNRSLSLPLEQILSLETVERDAILDCTGGWYSAQAWGGIPLATLLDLAGPLPQAQSVTIRSVTGYQRRFALEEAGGFLLATMVAGRPLTHHHGFPIRLVAPGRRGYQWVKWIQSIRVNRTSHLLQPPLPLQ